MTRVTYAQNFEDVLLWRVFDGISSGTYLDVGAQDPDRDSVSKAFYLAGWRGIHVEPEPGYASLLRKCRPDEKIFECAAGEREATVDLYAWAGSGRSTLSAEIARRDVPGVSSNFKCITVPMRTIDAILDEAAMGNPLWMKIDCEGSEGSAIRGWNRRSIRPWVVVIEAVEPDTFKPNYAEWEPLLVADGYRFVYDDHLNRFYVPEEKYDELARHFVYPVGVLDGALSYHYVELSESLIAREQEFVRTSAALQSELTRVSESFLTLARQYESREAECAVAIQRLEEELLRVKLAYETATADGKAANVSEGAALEQCMARVKLLEAELTRLSAGQLPPRGEGLSGNAVGASPDSQSPTRRG